MIPFLSRSWLVLFFSLGFITGTFAQNLLVNGDFEQVDGTEPKGWRLSGANDGPLASTEGAFIQGNVSLHLKNPLGDEAKKGDGIYAVTVKPIPGIVGGKEYRLTFYAKGATPGQVLNAMYYTNPKVKPHFYKRKAFILTDNWSKYDFVLQMPAPWENRELSIRFELGKGEVYIDNANLQLDTPELKAAAAAATGKTSTEVTGQKNLVVNPGFELGWTGWGTGSYRDDEQPYEKDEVPSAIDSKIKYEGAASLRVEPNDCIVSVRFPIDVDEQYVLSFYARGEPTKTGSNHNAKVHILNTQWKNNKNVTLKVGEEVSGEWKRFSLPVKIKDLGSRYRNSVYVRIDSHDTRLWIDGVQLEKAAKPTDYNGGLQAGILSTSDTGLFTLGKPEQVSVAVACPGGLPQAVNVALTARDIFSNVIWKKDVPFGPTRNELSTVPLTLENKFLGVAEVTAAVGIPGQTPVSANTWTYCVIDGKPEDTKHNILFGTENVLGWAKWNEEYNERMANYLGSGFSRVFLWKSKGGDGSDALSIAREQLQRKKDSGKQVMICVGQPNHNLIHAHMDLEHEFTDAEVAQDVARYAEYCKKVATGLKGVVDYYQMLNEPNIWRAVGGALKGSKLMPPSRYIKYVAAGSAAVKSVDPTAKVVANINGTDATFTDELFALGAPKYIDTFTFHSYRQSPENSPVYESIMRLRSVIDKYAKGMPIINDEQYYGARDITSVSGEDLKDYYCDTQAEQAGKIVQNYLHHIAADRVTWSSFAVQIMLYRFGMGNPTYFYPSYGGYRFASQTLHDIERGTNVDVNPSLRVFLFERKDGVKFVSLNTKSFEVKGGVRKVQADAAFDVNGNPQSAADLPVSYQPSYFMFKNATADQIMTSLKQADYYGFSAPIRVNVSEVDSSLKVVVENCENKPLNASLQFTKMPQGWSVPAPIDLSNLAAAGSKEFTFPIPKEQRQWDKDYSVEYKAVAGEKVISKTVKLPSIEASRKTINIDGDLADWQGIQELKMGEDHLSTDFSEGKLPHKGPQDLSATASIAWDDNNLYCSIKVTDDQFVPSNNIVYWSFDSVQVYFDMMNDGGKNYNGNDAAYTIGFSKEGKPVAYLEKNPTGRYVGDGNTERGIDDDVKVVSMKTDDGYLLEMAFPKTALPYLELKDGSVFGFSILVNDNDGGDRKQGVTLGAPGTEPSGKPSTWRTIRLSGK